MEKNQNFQIKKIENDGEAFVNMLADLIKKASGDNSIIKEILKKNHVNTNTIFLDQYITLLVKGSNDKDKLCDVIKDIGSMIIAEHSVFEDFETLDKDRVDPAWKDHQDTSLEILNKMRNKYNFPFVKLDNSGKNLI